MPLQTRVGWSAQSGDRRSRVAGRAGELPDVLVERPSRPGERFDVGLQRGLVIGQQPGELSGGGVQPGDRALQGRTVVVQRPGDRVVGLDELAQALLAVV